MLFRILIDREISKRARAGGMWQVLSVKIEDGRDITQEAGIDTHYMTAGKLGVDIAQGLGIPLEEVELVFDDNGEEG
jgi:hypothetical protein